jgi:hypothetical protein
VTRRHRCDHRQGRLPSDDIVKSAIDLAWHIVTAEVRFLNAVAVGAFDLTSAPPDTIERRRCESWALERFAKAVERLKQTSGDQLIKTVDFRGLFQFPAVVYIRRDEPPIHHRGRLDVSAADGREGAVDLRRSYDARLAREATQV